MWEELPADHGDTLWLGANEHSLFPFLRKCKRGILEHIANANMQPLFQFYFQDLSRLLLLLL